MEHRAKKRFGQNFLRDQNLIDRIVRSVNPQTDDFIVEIGPGLGAITQPLLKACEHVTAVELDKDVIEKLKSLPAKGEWRLINADALKTDFSELYPGEKIRVVGNLPYNISTPLLFQLLKFKQHIIDMHVMLQKEVVDRMGAMPGNKDYGRLSVMLQYHCQVIPLIPVPPDAFVPKPKVDSMVARLKPFDTVPFKADNEGHFSSIVSRAFEQRRKTLRKSLKGLVEEEAFEKANIDPGIRPEQLSVEAFVNLSNACAP